MRRMDPFFTFVHFAYRKARRNKDATLSAQPENCVEEAFVTRVSRYNRSEALDRKDEALENM